MTRSTHWTRVWRSSFPGASGKQTSSYSGGCRRRERQTRRLPRSSTTEHVTETGVAWVDVVLDAPSGHWSRSRITRSPARRNHPFRPDFTLCCTALRCTTTYLKYHCSHEIHAPAAQASEYPRSQDVDSSEPKFPLLVGGYVCGSSLRLQAAVRIGPVGEWLSACC